MFQLTGWFGYVRGLDNSGRLKGLDVLGLSVD